MFAGMAFGVFDIIIFYFVLKPHCPVFEFNMV